LGRSSSRGWHQIDGEISERLYAKFEHCVDIEWEKNHGDEL